MHTSKITCVVSLGIILSSCGGNVRINIPRPDDAQYRIRNVVIQGPAQIRQDPTMYTITFEVVAQNDGGAVTPLVSLLDDDSGVRFGDDLLAQSTMEINPVPITRGTYTGRALMGLSCTPTFNVQGNLGSSGEGGRMGGFAPFDFVDEAEVYAKVSRGDGSGAVTSGVIDVDCAQP